MAQPVVTTRILRRLLKTGAHFRAEKLLERIHPADLGPLLADLTPDEIRIVVDLLFKHRRAATMLMELPHDLVPEILDALDEPPCAVLAALSGGGLVGGIAAALCSRLGAHAPPAVAITARRVSAGFVRRSS